MSDHIPSGAPETPGPDQPHPWQPPGDQPQAYPPPADPPHQAYPGPGYPPQAYPLPQRQGRSPIKLALLIGGVALVAFFLIAIFSVVALPTPSSPAAASIGDCMSGGDPDSMKVLPCDDPKAEYAVIGKIEGKTEAEFNTSDLICEAHPTTDYVLWTGRSGRRGDVLCLEPLER